MTSPHSTLSNPFHVILSDPLASNPAFQSLLYSIENDFFDRPAPETHKGDGESRAEKALVRHHHVHHLPANKVTPFFDVHESQTAYFLEGEFPGISDKNAIVIEKVGPRTLTIEAKLSKLNLHDEWRAEPRAGLFKQFDDTDQTPTQAEDTTSQEITDGGVNEPKPTPVAPEEDTPGELGKKKGEIEAGDTRTPSWIQMSDTKRQHEEGVKTLVLERHAGLLGRSFTFPKAVDFDGLKAKLQAGLLRIMVPKAEEHEQPKRQRIPIVD
jgi:HSP20 family molecular chaperone IbpA